MRGATSAVLITLAMVAAAALPSPATAQPAGGSQLDPDSPAGVEYELPLDRARRDASSERRSDRPDGRVDRGGGDGSGGGGADAGSAGGGADPPAFGVGISRAPTDAGGGAGRSDRTGRGRLGRVRENSGGSSGRAGAGGSGQAPGGRDLTGAAADADASSATFQTLGIAAAVLCLGLGAGFLLRRLMGRPR